MDHKEHRTEPNAYYQTLEDARSLARERYPDAAIEQHNAFANTIAYLVHGESGGYGGPSSREHLACSLHAGERLAWEQATREMLDPQGPIFGPITDKHRFMAANEYCFDDAPADREALGLI